MYFIRPRAFIAFICSVSVCEYMNLVRGSRPHPHTAAMDAQEHQACIMPFFAPSFRDVRDIVAVRLYLVLVWSQLGQKATVRLVSSTALFRREYIYNREVPQCLVFLCTNARSMHRSVVKKRSVSRGVRTGKVITIVASG